MFTFKRFILDKKYFLLLSAVYFILRLTNLTKLPIFNDEAIYLDWGWRETHIPGNLYYSLYDGKQPFLMWIFGIFEHFLPDPLFAGRLVSVLFGFATVISIYKIGKAYFNTSIAYIAFCFYIIIPIFSYYDRQALMESAIGCIGVSSCYVFLRLLETNSKKYSIFLGILLGVGYFIKSSALIFLLTFFIISIIIIFLNKINKKILFKNIGIVFLTIFFVDLLLLIQPLYWQTLSTNSRYSLTIGELLHFPISKWLSNFWGNMEKSFFFVTPIVFILGIAGIVMAIKDKKLYIVALWFIACFLLQTSLMRNLSQRYIISFLPLFALFSAFASWYLFSKWKVAGMVIFLSASVIAFIITFLQIFTPQLYFTTLAYFTRNSENIYEGGFTGGVGIPETVEFLKKEAKENRLVVGVAVNTGNPESALITYFNKSKNVRVKYFDSLLYSEVFKGVDCLESKDPFYFVSRDEQQGGFNKYFSKYHTITIPRSKSSIGIYAFKNPCEGKKLVIDFFER